MVQTLHEQVGAMKRERPVRKLVADQLAARHGIDLIAVAHALEEEFGIQLPREQLGRLGSYGDLLQLLRDMLAAGTETMTDEELASCFVRARVVAGGSDGRVLLVRVGWLTPDLAAAIADDVRHAPAGTWLQVSVPDDLADAELASLHQWLRWLVSQHVRVDVRRTTQRSNAAMGQAATPGCDRLTQADGSAATGGHLGPRSPEPGTGLAPLEEEQDRSQPRRSKQ